MTRKFFQIGFNKCGTTFIARLFAMNGYPAIHWAEGALAEDIAYAKLTGTRPLRPWADGTVAFTDMESVRYLNMPIIEAFREYRFLDESFPGSVFLLNTRRVEDWVVSRFMHRGGSYARAHAQIRGVAVGDLADLWAAEWDAHLAACRTYFANRATFVEIDIDNAGPGDYRAALAPWFDLPQCPARPGAGAASRRAASLGALARMLTAAPVAVTPATRNRIGTLIARAARPARLAPPDGTTPDAWAEVDLDRNEVRDGQGQALPLVRGPGGVFHAGAATTRLLRIATTANDIAQAAGHGCYLIDMRPGPARGNGGPVLACRRSKGAANVFLWPMPWVHRLGNDGYLGRPGRADPPFADKRDRAARRGDPSGPAQADLVAATGDDALLSHRYLVCLSGSEDFLPFANSNSTVLLEEDGAETFARALFRPWRHYVPLAPGAVDLDDKLAWARAHPRRCQSMSARARAICAVLADPQGRRDQLAAILRDYRAATGQPA